MRRFLLAIACFCFLGASVHANAQDCSVAPTCTPTPTATFTETPTPTITMTPTNTFTPTVDVHYVVVLPSGHGAVVDATASIGEIALFALGALQTGLLILIAFYLRVRRR